MSKREDLLNGALEIFARDGYSRSSIASIAAEAQVSTRTVYNLYESKASLFHAAMLSSTRAVADSNIQLIRISTRGRDLRSAVMELATHFSYRDPRFAAHYALVRQVQAERDYIPQKTLDEWVSMGPLRVRAVLEDELRNLFTQAGVPLMDPPAAAENLLLLIGGDPVARGFYRDPPHTRDYIVTRARYAAHVFLAAYTNDPQASAVITGGIPSNLYVD